MLRKCIVKPRIYIVYVDNNAIRYVYDYLARNSLCVAHVVDVVSVLGENDSPFRPAPVTSTAI